MASVATTAIPSNIAAALPATTSTGARGASTSQVSTDGSDFSAVLAQNNAVNIKPPTKIDQLGKSENSGAKQAADESASTIATSANAASKSRSSTIPRIVDPKQIAAAAAQPATKTNQDRPSSGTAKKSSPASTAVQIAQQSAQSSARPILDGMQTGPGISALGSSAPGQPGDGTEHSGSLPQILWPDSGQAANQTASAPQSISDPTPGKSRAADSESVPATNVPPTLQSDAAALSTALLSNSDIASQAPTPKNAVTLQPKTPSQLTALVQSLEPHREASPQSPQAQTPATQSPTNAAPQDAKPQNQSADNGNSNSRSSHGDQAGSASDSGSSQSVQTATVADAAVAPPASAPSGGNGAANPTADGVGAISVAVSAQNANTGTGSAALHVAPAPQTGSQTAPPDLTALAINIAAKSQAGAKQFDISLEPAELGRVEVRLTVDNAGNAQAHLVAERPETLQMLQRDQASLSHALKDSGVQLGNSGLQFSLKGQERQGDGAQQSASRGKPLSASIVTTTDKLLPVSSTYGLSLSQAGIDIRV